MTLSLAMKLLIAVALLVVGLSPCPGSGQEGDGKWLLDLVIKSKAALLVEYRHP